MFVKSCDYYVYNYRKVSSHVTTVHMPIFKYLLSHVTVTYMPILKLEIENRYQFQTQIVVVTVS